MTGGLVARPVAAGADACLEPSVKEINVNQGLPHNNRQTPLVRGKTTLVKFYLALNTCAPIGTSIQINRTGTTLDVYRVKSDGTTERLNAQNGTPVAIGTVAATSAISSTGQSDNSAGDPIFKVPGWMLAPSSTTAAYTIRFDVHLSYTTKVAGLQRQAGTLTPTNPPNPTATVAQRSGAIRVLAVPMGDASQAAESQFSTTPALLQSSSALQALQNGFATLGRILPVPDGIDDLTNAASTAGIRWHLDQGLLDIGPNGLNLPKSTNGKYCIDSDAFNATAATLDNYLTQWNAQNQGTGTTADRVVGVIDSNISNGTEAAGCLEGYAGVPSSHSFVRAVHDASYSSSDARDTGPVLAMELLHTVGLVPPRTTTCTTCRGTPSFHSPSTTADTGTDLNRGYNLATNGYLPGAHSAMTFVTPFTNANTLLEQSDWADVLCSLGGGASPTGLCPSTAEESGIGTTNGVAAQARFVVAGLTDDRPEDTPNVFGTRITDAFYSTTQQESANDPTSAYYFVAYAGSTETRRLQVKVTKTTSAHDHVGDADLTAPVAPCPVPYSTETCGTFAFAVDAPSSTDRYELWKGAPGQSGSTKLLTELKTATPVVTSVNVANGGNTTTVALTSDANADETDPALSPDGQWLAFIRRPILPTGPATCTELVVAHIGGTTLGARAYLPGDSADASAASVSNPLPCNSAQPAQPAWRPDGRALAYVSGGTLRLVGFTPASNPDNAGAFGNAQDFAPCVSVLNAGGACVTTDTGIRRLSNVANPAWSLSTTWPGSASPGYRIAFDADGLLSAGRDTFTIDPRDEPNATSSGPLLAPSVDVAQNAVEPSFSQSVATATRLAYTQTGSTKGIGSVDAASPGSGVSVSTRGRRGSYGDRFIAIESTNASGTPTGDIALLDYNADNAKPAPVTVVKSGTDTSPSLAVTNDAGDPFGQRLAFERAGTTRDIRLLVLAPSDRRAIVVEGTDDDPADSRASIFLNCDGQYNVLAAGVRPAAAADGTVRFEVVVDASWFVCGDNADSARVAAVITDQFSMSNRFDGGSIGSKPKRPSVAILTPGPGDSLRPSADIPLVGTAKDAWDRELTGSSLVWRVTNPAGQVVFTGTGQSTSMPTPANYLTIGTWTVSLTATNEFGLSTETRSTFRVEPTPMAATVDFDPNALTVPIDTSGPPQVTVYVTVNGADLSTVDPATVRITRIEQYDVSGDSQFTATAWSASGSSGQAKFDKTYLATWLYSKGLYGRLVKVTVSANSGAAPGAFGFAGYDPTAPCAHLQNQGATC